MSQMFLVILQNKTLRRDLTKNFDKVAPCYFLYNKNGSTEISKELRKAYSLENIKKKKSLRKLNEVSVARIVH